MTNTETKTERDLSAEQIIVLNALYAESKKHLEDENIELHEQFLGAVIILLDAWQVPTAPATASGKCEI